MLAMPPSVPQAGMVPFSCRWHITSAGDEHHAVSDSTAKDHFSLPISRAWTWQSELDVHVSQESGALICHHGMLGQSVHTYIPRRTELLESQMDTRPAMAPWP